MANRVTIDVEARFIDRVTVGMNTAAKSSDRLQKSTEKANKELDKLAKKNVKPKLGADDNAFTKKIRQAQSKAEKLGRTKVAATLGAVDKASAKIGQVTGAARAFGSKVFKASVSVADKASSVIGSVTGAARSFAGRTFSAAVKIVDYATTPLRKIKDALFNIKTLIGAIVLGAATKTAIMNPINLADQYTGAKIGFSTLLGESEGQAMMDEIDAFAKATPFKTSNTISSIQKMMAYGWDATKVIEDMKVIGDAAAATGKGDQGLESIVYALSEIRSKGKLSTQELNQLASAGIKAKAYLAEGLGFGSDDAGMAKLSKALEDGAVGANQAIELILEGMKEFDGMMDRTANETVEGLWSQLQDTFEINILRKWGQGLQDGAKRGFGSIVELLGTSEKALEDFGDLVYDVGKEFSNWTADKLEKTVELIKEITETDTFKEASLGGKIKILWDKVIAEPFEEWWSSKGKKWLAEKAEGFGEGLGTGISAGLLALLGVDATGMVGEGISIGASFAKGFSEGFDGSAVTDALVNAISNVWDALPTWAKILIGGYGAGKVAGAYTSLVGGISNLIGMGKSVIGSTGNSMVQGTGLLNFLANTGYKLTGGAASAGGYFGAGTAMSGGMAAATGAGAIAAGLATGKGLFDLYGSVKAYKSYEKTGNRSDLIESNAKSVSGGVTIGGVAAGAAIGSAILPGVGTLIGAGIGGIAGWLGGNKLADNVRKAQFETEEMKEAIEDSEKSAEDLAMEFEKVVNRGIADHFGDIKLSMEEIQIIADKIAIGEKAEEMTKFVKATETAATTLQGMQTSAESLDRLNWKVGLGLKLDETEIEEYRAAIDNYMASAKQYVEDKHYEFTAAVSLLMDVSEGDGKTLLEGGNAFYSQLKEQIDSASSELSSTVNIALKDGVITLDEQAEITNLQNQIAEITNKLAEAETEAGFEAIKIKFGESNISDESFKELQTALQEQLDESGATYENALEVGLTNIQLQYDEGLITEEERERLKGVLEDTFNTQMDDLKIKVEQVQLDIIGESYQDILGEDGAEKLSSAIEQSLKDGISPAEWSTDDVRKFLNMDSMSEEAAGQIATLFSNMEFDTGANVNVTNTMLGTGGIPLADEAANGRTNVQESVDSAFLNPLTTAADAQVTLNWSITNPTASIGLTNNGTSVSASIATNNYNGGIISGGPQLSWLDEENMGEAVIPFNPSRRARALQLFAETGRRLGVLNHANGGIIGGDSEPIKPFNGEVKAGSGEQKIEINMGGVTIEINADGNKSISESIEEQEQEIAEKVAKIFKNVLGAQFANMPLRGGT